MDKIIGHFSLLIFDAVWMFHLSLSLQVWFIHRSKFSCSSHCLRNVVKVLVNKPVIGLLNYDQLAPLTYKRHSFHNDNNYDNIFFIYFRSKLAIKRKLIMTEEPSSPKRVSMFYLLFSIEASLEVGSITSLW